MWDKRSGWLFCMESHLVFGTSDGGRSWRTLTMPWLSAERLDAGHFVTRDDGWVLAAPPRLYETLDGGRRWYVKALPSADGLIQTVWSLPGQARAWAGGGVFRPSGHPSGPNWAIKRYNSGGWALLQSVIYARSAGGGWTAQAVPPCDLSIFDLRFWDERRGIALGDRCLYWTDTGGQRWNLATFHGRYQNTRGRFPYLGAESPALRPPRVAFLGGAAGWLSLDDNLLFGTRDGGRNWSAVGLPGTPYFDQMAFTDSQHGLALHLGRGLYETVDGGVKWTRLRVDFLAQSLNCTGGGRCWVLSNDVLYVVTWE